MGQFLYGRRFMFLPNTKPPSLQFLSSLVVKNGATVVTNVDELDDTTVILINDSYVDKKGRLINQEIFQMEFESDALEVWDYIENKTLKCVKASSVSEWIQQGKFELKQTQSVDINRLVGSQSQTQSFSSFSDKGQRNSSSSTTASATDIEAIADAEMALIEQEEKEEEEEGKALLEADKIEYEEREISHEQNTTALPDKEPEPNNKKLIEALARLAKRFSMKGEQFRSRGYHMAKVAIEKYPHTITSGKQAQREIDNVGPSIAKKIQIILDTGLLPGLDESFHSEKRLEYFSRCHGIGIGTAKRWNLNGLDTFYDALVKFPEDFQNDWPILFGWSYYEDWSRSLSRQECEAHFAIVQNTLRTVDPHCQVEVHGSYRRGAERLGDIDLLFFKPECDDMDEIADILESLAIRLWEEGFIQCFLQLTPKLYNIFGAKVLERFEKCQLPSAQKSAFSNERKLRKFFLGTRLQSHDGESFAHMEGPFQKLKPKDKFLSLSVEDRRYPCRRLDFFSCKWSELGAARIQWTSGTDYNRWIRLYAADKGMKLTQHGLYKDNILLESFDEKRIFELLGIEYAEPSERRIIPKKMKINDTVV